MYLWCWGWTVPLTLWQGGKGWLGQLQQIPCFRPGVHFSISNMDEETEAVCCKLLWCKQDDMSVLKFDHRRQIVWTAGGPLSSSQTRVWNLHLYPVENQRSRVGGGQGGGNPVAPQMWISTLVSASQNPENSRAWGQMECDKPIHLHTCLFEHADMQHVLVNIFALSNLGGNGHFVGKDQIQTKQNPMSWHWKLSNHNAFSISPASLLVVRPEFHQVREPQGATAHNHVYW